jgi:hypothetical protein
LIEAICFLHTLENPTGKGFQVPKAKEYIRCELSVSVTSGASLMHKPYRERISRLGKFKLLLSIAFKSFLSSLEILTAKGF